MKLISHTLSPPQVARAAVSFGAASVKEAAGVVFGMPKTTAEEAERRMAVCTACDNIDPVWQTCKLCNCYMPRKTTWRTVGCPEGKW